MANPIPLDPSKWERPTINFIGRLDVCEYSDTDQVKGREDGRTITEQRGWPRAGQTWHQEVTRLDAVLVNKDTGEEVPAKRYQTIDLERYDQRSGQMRAVVQGNNKAAYIIEKWGAAKVGLAQPEANVGMIAEWCVELSHSFGGDTPAKNLLYPVRVLASPKDADKYQFRGEVERIEFTPKGNEQSLEDMAQAVQESPAPASGRGRAASATSNGAKAPAFTHTDLLNALVGITVTEEGPAEEEVMAIVSANKASLDAATKMGLADNSLIAEAIEKGEMTVVDGKLALAS